LRISGIPSDCTPETLCNGLTHLEDYKASTENSLIVSLAAHDINQTATVTFDSQESPALSACSPGHPVHQLRLTGIEGNLTVD
jgi:hypothetical protein